MEDSHLLQTKPQQVLSAKKKKKACDKVTV